MASSSQRPLSYKALLANDLGWALAEGSAFFEGKGRLQLALRKIANRLDALGIPYAQSSGGWLPFLHGFRRFTEDTSDSSRQPAWTCGDPMTISMVGATFGRSK